MQSFQNRSAVVLFVEPSGSTRQVMAEALKARGFTTVQGVASVEDALAQLETEHIDWVITSLFADQPINGLQILNLILETPHLQHIRCSLILDEDEAWCIEKAYSLGMLSHHAKPITKESITSELEHLMKRLEGTGWRGAVTAAEYLRAYLSARGEHEALLDFERSIVDTFPGEGALLLNLGRAQHAASKSDAAKTTLSQARMIDPSLSDGIESLAKQLFGDSGLSSSATAEPRSVNVLNLDNVVVIDSDDAIRAAVGDVLKELGVPTTHLFPDGQAAWKWLEKNPEPQLVVMEWRLLKLSAPVLMQRIRQQEHINVPFIVVSSLLKPTDMPLVREIGISNIVSKPVERQTLLKALIWTIQQERSPTEFQSQELKIRKLLAGGKKADAVSLAKKFLTSKVVPVARKKYIEAELAFSVDDYARCRDLGVEALRMAGDTLLVLNLLGKVFMRLGDFESALKCFEKAQQMSPLNIERLCNMAEAQTELGQDEKAEATLKGAGDIDPDSKLVAEAQINKAVIGGDLEAAKALMSQMESVSNVVAYMNNKAVAMARCDKFDDGIALYKKTLEALPDNKADIEPLVRYNMALAKVRGGDLEGAMKDLEAVIKVNNSRAHKKALSLLKKVKHANDKGSAVALAQDETSTSAGSADSGSAQKGESATNGDGTPVRVGEESAKDAHEYLLATMAPQRGDICCYMLHNPPLDRVEKANALLKNMPRFKRRSAIARDESMGADRVAKSKAS